LPHSGCADTGTAAQIVRLAVSRSAAISRLILGPP
jgi:hypothetical protein